MRVFLALTFLFFATAYSLAASASSSMCFELFLKSNNLGQNPSLLEIQPHSPSEALDSNVVSFDRSLLTVQTELGPIQMRSAIYKSLQATLALFNGSKSGRSEYVHQVITSKVVPAYVNRGFLDWVVRGYGSALEAFARPHPPTADFMKRYQELLPPPGKKEDRPPNVISLKGDPFDILQSFDRDLMREISEGRGRNQDAQRGREAGLESPFQFVEALESPSTGYLRLRAFESEWLFRILVREPVVRAALLRLSFFRDVSEHDLKEYVFFVSAFPELFSLASQMQELGFVFDRYSLTDGRYTEGLARSIFSDGSAVVKASLVIAKSVSPDSEVSFAQLGVFGYDSLTDSQYDRFEGHVFENWQNFKRENHLDQSFELHVGPDAEDIFGIIVIAPAEQQVVVTSKFFLYLAEKAGAR